MKKIKVVISQTLSSSKVIEVPDDFDSLWEEAIEQVVLPSDHAENNEDYTWTIDDICVIPDEDI